MPVKYSETTQANFQTGTLTTVTADSDDYLRLTRRQRAVQFATGAGNRGIITDDIGHTGLPISFECWFKANKDGIFRYIIDCRQAGDTTRFYVAKDSINSIEVCGQDMILAAEWTADQLYHLAVVIQSGSPAACAVYLDGNLIRITANAAFNNAGTIGANIRIGARFNDIDQWTTTLDDVRLWDKILLQAEIDQHVDEPWDLLDRTDLMLCVPFYEGSGATAADFSGNGYDCTLTGATWVTDGHFEWGNFNGNRVTPAISLASITNAYDSVISWNTTIYTGTTVTIETSLNGGGVWSTATNGQPIPGIDPGDDESANSLLIRQTLTTNDPLRGPRLDDMFLEIGNTSINDSPTSLSLTVVEQNTTRQIHSVFEVFRSGVWEDLTDYLAVADVNLGDVTSIGTGASGADAIVRQATFTIHNTRDDRFEPLDTTSPWNQVGMSYVPLLFPNRLVRFSVAITAAGVAPSPSDYFPLFEGYLGDSIKSNGFFLVCECRDRAKFLQDTIIEGEYEITVDVQVEVIIQDLLDTVLGPGAVTLYTPADIDWVVTAAEIPPFRNVSVWDAIQEIVAQRGLFCGYRYDLSSKTWRLTLLDPPRNKDASDADYSLNYIDDLYVNDLDITDKDIRNRVTVFWQEVQSNGASLRESVTKEDLASQAIFGVRAMSIEEDKTSLIRTSADAEAFADAILADLSNLTATTQIDMPLRPEMDLFDGVLIADARHSNTDQFYGIDSVRHVVDYSGKKFRTIATASGRVIGGHQRWLDSQARPGADRPADVGNIAPASIWTQAVQFHAITAVADQRVSDSGTTLASIYPVSQTVPSMILQFTLYEETPMLFQFDCLVSLEGNTLGTNEYLASTFWLEFSSVPLGGGVPTISVPAGAIRNPYIRARATSEVPTSFLEAGYSVSILLYQLLQPAEYTVTAKAQKGGARYGGYTPPANFTLQVFDRSFIGTFLKR
jgi:hypothetical protein